MDEPARTRRLVEWAFAAFHASLFLLALILLLYLRDSLGSLLGGLNTLVGLALGGLLWATTWWTTRRGFASLIPANRKAGILSGPPVKIWAVVFQGMLWGAADGLLFYLGLVVLGLVFIVLPGMRSGPISFGVLFAYTILGGMAAAAVGGAAGLILGVADSILVGFARSLVEVRPAETGNE